MKLKTKLSKLRHDGHITDAEYSIIINALNRKPKERVIAEIKVDEDTLRKIVNDKVEELKEVLRNDAKKSANETPNL